MLSTASSVYTSSLFKVILAIHIMAVVVAFGVTFAYPIIFLVGAKHGPSSLPLLHRIEYTIERWLTNPGLLIVVLAGIYLASKAHLWSSFFVQWGLGAAIVIGGVVGAVMIPTAVHAEQIAKRDLEAGASAGGGSVTQVTLSEEYRGLARRLSIVGTGLSLLVLVTILFMAIHP